MKRLLVTSDDFGMCHAINVGTVRAMKRGIVRSTNLMAACPWFEEAAALCREHALPAGVHLTLTCEWDRMRWGPLTRAPSLRDARGWFFSSHESVAAVADESDIRAEFTAQIERVRAAGIVPTHLDTHMLTSAATDPHARLVQGIARELGKHFGIPFTYERSATGSLRWFTAELEISSFTTEHVWQTLESWTAPGTYYLSGHAAESSEELRALSSLGHEAAPWSEAYRIRDLDFFTADATRDAVAAAGFTLIGVSDLLQP